MMEKLYADRDIETQGQIYMNHVNAMTAEGLHSKSDIAAELAHRDIRIAELEQDVKVAKGQYQGACDIIKQLEQQAQGDKLDAERWRILLHHVGVRLLSDGEWEFYLGSLPPQESLVGKDMPSGILTTAIDRSIADKG